MFNEAGYGSIHFKGSDVVGSKDLESLNKIPVYVYEGENKTNKVFSGSYVNIVPSNLAMHADLDPRCDTDSDHYFTPGSWVKPEVCDAVVCNPQVEICSCDPTQGPCSCNPGVDICLECDPAVHNCDPPTVCAQSTAIPVSPCTSNNVQLSGDPCKIYGNSVVVLNNGMVMYAYMTPDSNFENSIGEPEFNINRIFVALQKTTPSVDILVNRDVAIEPKEIDYSNYSQTDTIIAHKQCVKDKKFGKQFSNYQEIVN